MFVPRPNKYFQVVKNLDCRRISSACLRFFHVCHETAKCLNSNIYVLLCLSGSCYKEVFCLFFVNRGCVYGLIHTETHTCYGFIRFFIMSLLRHNSQDEDQTFRVFSHWKCKQTRLASGKSEILVESAVVLCWRQFACLTMQKEKFGICNICNNSDVIVRNPPEK